MTGRHRFVGFSLAFGRIGHIRHVDLRLRPHPTGDIRATYAQPGTHEVRADIVYTGQFRVGGSQWFDIPGDVDLPGTPVTLTVREAMSRLYTN